MSTPTELNEEFFRVNLQKVREPDEFIQRISDKEFIEELPARFAAGEKALDIIKPVPGFTELDLTLQKAVEKMIIDRGIDGLKIEDRPTALLSGIAEVQKEERTKKIDFVLALSTKSDTIDLSKKELLEALDIMQDIVDSKFLLAHIRQIKVEHDPLPKDFYQTVTKEIKAFANAYRKHTLEPLDALADTSTAPQATPIPPPPKRYNPPRKAETPKQPESKQSETPANASAQTPAAKTEAAPLIPQTPKANRPPPPKARTKQPDTSSATPATTTEVPGYLKPYISPDDNRMKKIYETNVVGQIFLEDINHVIAHGHKKKTLQTELSKCKNDKAVEGYLTKMLNFDTMPSTLQEAIIFQIRNAELHTTKKPEDRATKFLNTIKGTIEAHQREKFDLAEVNAKIFLSNPTRVSAKNAVIDIVETWGKSEKEAGALITNYLNNPTTTDEAAVAFAGQFINNFFSAADKQGLVKKPPQLFVVAPTATATATPTSPTEPQKTATTSTSTPSTSPSASTSTTTTTMPSPSPTLVSAPKVLTKEQEKLAKVHKSVMTKENQHTLNAIHEMQEKMSPTSKPIHLLDDLVAYYDPRSNIHQLKLQDLQDITVNIYTILDEIANALPPNEREKFLKEVPKKSWPTKIEALEVRGYYLERSQRKFIDKLIKAERAITEFQKKYGAKAWSSVDASPVTPIPATTTTATTTSPTSPATPPETKADASPTTPSLTATATASVSATEPTAKTVETKRDTSTPSLMATAAITPTTTPEGATSTDTAQSKPASTTNAGIASSSSVTSSTTEKTPSTPTAGTPSTTSTASVTPSTTATEKPGITPATTPSTTEKPGITPSTTPAANDWKSRLDSVNQGAQAGKETLSGGATSPTALASYQEKPPSNLSTQANIVTPEKWKQITDLHQAKGAKIEKNKIVTAAQTIITKTDKNALVATPTSDNPSDQNLLDMVKDFKESIKILNNPPINLHGATLDQAKIIMHELMQEPNPIKTQVSPAIMEALKNDKDPNTQKIVAFYTKPVTPEPKPESGPDAPKPSDGEGEVPKPSDESAAPKPMGRSPH